MKAELIEANLDDVGQVIDIIRSALANRFFFSPFFPSVHNS